MTILVIFILRSFVTYMDHLKTASHLVFLSQEAITENHMKRPCVVVESVCWCCVEGKHTYIAFGMQSSGQNHQDPVTIVSICDQQTLQ